MRSSLLSKKVVQSGATVVFWRFRGTVALLIVLESATGLVGAPCGIRPRQDAPHLYPLQRRSFVPVGSKGRAHTTTTATTKLSAVVDAAARVRVAELDDLEEVVATAHREFSVDYDSNLEKAALKLALWIGFFLRLACDDPRDHAVLLCRDSKTNAIEGMCELSLQRPGKLAAAIPPPQWFKKVTAGGARQLRPYLSNLLVVKTKRRRGLGRALVRRCEAFAKTWGFDSLSLHYDADDASLRRFYDKLGFKVFEDPRRKRRRLQAKLGLSANFDLLQLPDHLLHSLAANESDSSSFLPQTSASGSSSSSFALSVNGYNLAYAIKSLP